MDLGTRKLVDRYFTGFGVVSILLMAGALAVLLGPIIVRGIGAYVFRGTVEFRQLQADEFDRGGGEQLAQEVDRAYQARAQLYDSMAAFEAELEEMGFLERREYAGPYNEFKDAVHDLLGPVAGTDVPVMPRDRYGPTRWDQALEKQHSALHKTAWDYGDGTQMGKIVYVPRVGDFEGTRLEPAFTLLEERLEEMLLPRWTVYWGFLTDDSLDAHIFGGIWPEILGTFYLTLGAMLFAVPMGVIAAIYLVEYAQESKLLSVLRVCISTLAGVPSIVFGLFGLAFFINTIHVSPSKSVLAGSLTLGLLVLPTVIRASEEALRAVPNTYREASLSLGSTKWGAICRVILPAALPGILTSIVISMGRAAGETAPIIFTAAVSVGKPIGLFDTFTRPTPALPWNIYNLATEHEAVDEIRHVQFGMVFTLIVLVMLLNGTAIITRARILRKLRG